MSLTVIRMLSNYSLFLRSALLIWACALAPSAHADLPEWIWHDNHGAKPADHEVRFFRKTFAVEGQVTKAMLTAVGDDAIQVYINGKMVLKDSGWAAAKRVDVTRQI